MRIAVDVGSVRVGVARSDAQGSMAFPVETVPRASGDIQRICDLVAEYESIEVIVGHPVNLAGERGPAALAAEAFARELADAVKPLKVRLVDERMSTSVAQRNLHAAGRSTKKSRAVIDQQAAVVILQDALDAERRSGALPGVDVPVSEQS